MLRFNLWERGSGGLASVIEKLVVKVVTLAACDLIMEYQLLTVPMCEVSQQLRDDLDRIERHAVSAPTSPFLRAAENEGRYHQVLFRIYNRFIINAILHL